MKGNPFTNAVRTKKLPLSPAPVLIRLERKHAFKKKPVKPGNKKASPGCAICDLPKMHIDHIGSPPSLNALGSGDRRQYQEIKKCYEEAIVLALEQSGLDKNLQRVEVHCKMAFPDKHGRDEGNFRFIPEKAMGDVLVRGYGYSTGSKKKGNYKWYQVADGGWLKDDTFYPIMRYRFNNIDPIYDKGNSWVEYLIYASK